MSLHRHMKKTVKNSVVVWKTIQVVSHYIVRAYHMEAIQNSLLVTGCNMCTGS